MKIMVCLDSSKQAPLALYKATEWANKLDAEVHLVTSFITQDRFYEQDIEAAKKMLAESRTVLEKAGIPCRTHVSVRGLEPGEDLALYAKEEGIEAIFVGIKKRSKIGKLLLGSVAQHLILNAGCPVVTVQ